MSTTLTHRGLPLGISRLHLLSLVEDLGKRGIGVSSSAARLLEHLIWRSRDGDYDGGRICAVWERVCRTADDLGLSSRAINQAERELEAKGFVIRTTGGNGARSGSRTDGQIRWAAGINLAPLINRYAELKAVWDARCLQQQAIAECKAEIRRLRRLIRAGGEASGLARAEEILPDGRIAPINRMDRLETIRGQLAELLADISIDARATESSDPSEENDRRIIQDRDSSRPCRPRAAEPSITPATALDLASNDYRAIVRSLGGASWPNLIEASHRTALGSGLGQRSWGQACATLGRERAALCVLVVDRNARLRQDHRYRAEHPAKCFSGMVRRAASRSFNLHGLLKACPPDPEAPSADAPPHGVMSDGSSTIASLTTALLSRTLSLMENPA
ncbi:MAG TPA: helix-turn-helix domain-containing protein [Sphingobium sp.]|uniref:helix-turn-helix domain-containing protein n=1 Tax=Sphingobium sp. TaxID=1912891 RepID=UPI002ED23855